MSRLDPVELEHDIRQNHYLIGLAIEARNWRGALGLAESLVRLIVLLLAASPEPPTRHFQGSIGIRLFPPARPTPRPQAGQGTRQ